MEYDSYCFFFTISLIQKVGERDKILKATKRFVSINADCVSLTCTHDIKNLFTHLSLLCYVYPTPTES